MLQRTDEVINGNVMPFLCFFSYCRYLNPKINLCTYLIVGGAHFSLCIDLSNSRQVRFYSTLSRLSQVYQINAKFTLCSLKNIYPSLVAKECFNLGVVEIGRFQAFFSLLQYCKGGESKTGRGTPKEQHT